MHFYNEEPFLGLISNQVTSQSVSGPVKATMPSNEKPAALGKLPTRTLFVIFFNLGQDLLSSKIEYYRLYLLLAQYMLLSFHRCTKRTL